MKDKNPIINPVVVLRKEFDDWAVLFNPDTAEAVGINPIGVVIWEQLANHQSVTDIIKTIRNKYSSVPDKAEKEVDTFINSLTERGFVGFEVENKD